MHAASSRRMRVRGRLLRTKPRMSPQHQPIATRTPIKQWSISASRLVASGLDLIIGPDTRVGPNRRREKTNRKCKLLKGKLERREELERAIF